MNIKFTNIDKQCNEMEKEYPIKNILSYLADTLGENILIRDIVTINNNVMLEVSSLDTNDDYFIKLSKVLEEHPFINRIAIIISNSNKTYFIKYMYTYTKDSLGFIMCKVVEKYKKGNVWITKNICGIKVESDDNFIKENVKVKTR